jgi:hypothetical protein
MYEYIRYLLKVKRVDEIKHEVEEAVKSKIEK